MPEVPLTLLALDGIPFVDWAARGITMTMQRIGTGALRRDVNGGLHDLTESQFRLKRQATISCTDMDAPDFSDIRRGSPVTVTCVPGLGVDGEANTAGAVVIDMLVDDWSTSRDEWGAWTTWQLSLIEV